MKRQPDMAKLASEGVSGETMQQEPFDDYVALADQGPTSARSIVLGFIVVLVTWVAGTFAAFAVGGFVLALSGTQGDSSEYLDVLLSGHTGAVIMLGSIGSMWLGVWLALRYVHRRPFPTVLGAELRIDRSDIVRGLVATLIVSLTTTPVLIFLYGMPERTDNSVLQWLIWLGPMLALVLLQTSAEEVAFRGYLTQALARRFRSPLIWAGVPMVIFTLMHWYSEASSTINLAALSMIAAFAAAATLLVYLTGNLGAAMGVHWGVNIVALLVFSSDPELNSIALFMARPLEDPAWTTNEAMQMVASGLFEILATVWLLIHPSSPLRLRSLWR